MGMWLAKMADICPHSDCVGVDIVALQHEWVSPACIADDSHQHPNYTFVFVEAPRGLRISPDETFDVVQVTQMPYSVSVY